MDKIKRYRYDSPIGWLELGEDGKGICQIDFLKDSLQRPEEENDCICRTPLLEEAAGQLEEYFAGQRKTFCLPLSLSGTDFQKRVWNALRKIPWGETRSYGQIAQMIGNPKACRAVGMANHANRIVIVIPCHRVIGADGSLTGYGGGLEIKRKLLELEGILIQRVPSETAVTVPPV